MDRVFAIVTPVTLIVVLVWFLLGNALFTVDEREHVVVLQFGEPVAGYSEPGLRWKVPFIQEIRRFPKTYQFWLGDGPEVLVDVPTADGKKIEVTAWAIWRITDPIRFLQELRTVANAELRIKEFVRSHLRDVITANSLVDVVRSSERKLTYTLQVERIDLELPSEAEAPPGEREIPARTLPAEQPGPQERVRLGREKLVARAKETVQRSLRQGPRGEEIRRGIELVDMGIARIDFVPTVQEAAFQRLIAFLESVAAFYVNEGERRKQEILNLTNYEVEKILGEGKREANRIRGEVEAEIIQMYSDALREMGEFYDFARTLEMYKKSLGPNTRLVLSTDAEIFHFLRQMPPVPTAGTAPVPASAAPPEAAGDAGTSSRSPAPLN
jgi:membrane protease subunit HflC